MAEDLHTARGGGRDDDGAALGEQAHVAGVDPIDVFGGVQRLDEVCQWDFGAERRLQLDGVDGGIGAQLLDQGACLSERRSGWQLDEPDGHPRLDEKALQPTRVDRGCLFAGCLHNGD